MIIDRWGLVIILASGVGVSLGVGIEYSAAAGIATLYIISLLISIRVEMDYE